MAGIKLNVTDLKEAEKVLHFCGVGFHSEATPHQRIELANKYLEWIMQNDETRVAFQQYAINCFETTWTFSTRISGLAVVIANYISGRNLFDRRLALNCPQLQNNEFYDHDPLFGRYVDELIGKPQAIDLFLKNNIIGKTTIKIADFGCAPKKDGSKTLQFLKNILTVLFPDKNIEFFGYDINYRAEYPVFDNSGNFVAWEAGYPFDNKRILVVDGCTYYDSNNPAFNIVPKNENARFTNTFDAAHNQYDIIINSMHYSLHEMAGEPPESLALMLQNLLAVRSPDGVLFLNTCDDCFKIYPSPSVAAHPNVIPFICSLDNICSKVSEILVGNRYCRGVHDSTCEQSFEQMQKVEKAVYQAHRLATRDVTFLDRLFEVYEQINEGATLDAALSSLVDKEMSIESSAKAITRNRVYALKKSTIQIPL